MKSLTIDDKENFLIERELNWSVEKQDIQTVSGIPILNQKAIVRTDTQDVLSIMGNTYEPYQNTDLIELLFRVSQTSGFDIAKAGFFGGGQKVYFQMKSDDLTMPSGDKIKGYLTAINSFDGSTSLAFGASNVTISCMNSFFSAFRQMENRARHTKNITAKVDEICRELERVRLEENVIFKNILKLSEKAMTKEDKVMVTKKLFNIKPNVDLTSDEVSTRTKNNITNFNNDLAIELANKGQTMWGLFSGVTRYTTHSVNQNTKTAYDSNSKMFNYYGKREQEIFNSLVDLLVFN